MVAFTLTTRSQIRHYIINMLKDEVDVGGRVYANRPTSPIVLEELPSVCVYFGDETTDVIAGSGFHVKEYERKALLVITIQVEEIIDPTTPINESTKGDDYLDFLGHQAERAMFHDWRLARRLPDFDPEERRAGLTHGSRLEGVSTYEPETEGERRVIAQDLRFLIPYRTPGYKDLKLDDFQSYYAALIRVGSDETTIDRVLLAAEGEIEDGNG